MWSSTVVFCAFFVLSAHSCGVPQTTQVPSTEAPKTEAPTSTTTLPTTTTTPEPTGTECETPTYVNQRTHNSEIGRMTLTKVSKNLTRFECNPLDNGSGHNGAISIEYKHIDDNGDDVGTSLEISSITAGASMQFRCDAEKKKYIGSRGNGFDKVVQRLRCNSFDDRMIEDDIKKELFDTQFPKIL